MNARSSTRRRLVAAGVVALSTVALAACGSDSGSSGSAASSAVAAAPGAVDLAAAGCPSTVVVQTDWNPEAEHGHLYQMLGDDAVIDADKKAVSGTLYAGGQPTGVKLEVRAGGPAIGFNQVAAQMYTDPEITAGYVTSDDQVANYASAPTKAFFAPLEISPLMVMWDPATYPNVSGIKDLKGALDGSGGVWRYFAGAAYMPYLRSAGFVSQASEDSSYDGTPANFVAAGGKDVQQGFASAEPYLYQNEIQNWAKPVKYDLISSAGWAPYQSSMVVRAADFGPLSGCLTALTPVLQQAEVDYFADPAKANALILKLVTDYNTGWTYSQGVADYSVKTMIDAGLVGNGSNAYIGDFDDARMADFFTKATTAFGSLGTTVDPNLKATDIYSNEFIDTSIGLAG